MTILETVKAGLNAVHEFFEQTPEKLRMRTVNYEMSDLKAKARYHGIMEQELSLREAFRPVNLPENTMRVWICVGQEDKHPPERKIALDIRVTSDDETEAGITRMKEMFSEKAHAITPCYPLQLPPEELPHKFAARPPIREI